MGYRRDGSCGAMSPLLPPPSPPPRVVRRRSAAARAALLASEGVVLVGAGALARELDSRAGFTPLLIAAGASSLMWLFALSPLPHAPCRSFSQVEHGMLLLFGHAALGACIVMPPPSHVQPLAAQLLARCRRVVDRFLLPRGACVSLRRCCRVAGNRCALVSL